MKIEDFFGAPTAPSDLGDDNFLLEEGLDLLAAYRSIQDREIRLALKKLVESIARKVQPPH